MADKDFIAALKAMPDIQVLMIEFLTEYQETPRKKMLKSGIKVEEMMHENMIYNTVESIKNKINELADLANQNRKA